MLFCHLSFAQLACHISAHFVLCPEVAVLIELTLAQGFCRMQADTL